MRLTYVISAPACIHHKIRGTMEVSHRFSSRLLILSAPPPPPIAHTLCTISAFVELAAEPIRAWLESACLPAKGISFIPSRALGITPQQQFLQETGREITSPRSEKTDFQQFKKFSDCNFSRQRKEYAEG